jgi:hypothetical protein
MINVKVKALHYDKGIDAWVFEVYAPDRRLTRKEAEDYAMMFQALKPSDRITTTSKMLREFSQWIDDGILFVGKSGEALTLHRVLKIGEEFGEVVDALTGVLAANPRKGLYGTPADVRSELLDVALTALGAYEHLCGNDGSSLAALLRHIKTRVERVGLKVPKVLT